MDRITIEGYNEEGTTTTPFDVGVLFQLCFHHLPLNPYQMMLCNRTSRFHVAVAAIQGGAKVNPKVSVVEHELVASLLHEVRKYRKFAFEHGIDVPGTYDAPKFD